jgi:hypothetical protein
MQPVLEWNVVVRGPILNEVDRFARLSTLLGVLLTGIYLAGWLNAVTTPSSGWASIPSLC